MEIQNTTAIPEIKKTIVIVRHLSGDEKVRQEAYYREKRLHDEATALGHARREGLAEGLTQGRAEGRAEGRSEVTQELTHRWLEMGMSEAEIKKLLGKSAFRHCLFRVMPEGTSTSGNIQGGMTIVRKK